MNTNYECQDCGPFRPCDCTFECSVCLVVSVGQPNHPGGICPDRWKLELADLLELEGWVKGI